ncbi:MAG: TIGR01212 family radical SAM protein [Bacteroidales bacterium]
MIYPWGDSRRYNSYARYFRQKFGQRVQKVTIDAGFTCPNRDGTVGTGGCHFCNNDGFNPSYCNPEKSVTRQIEEGIEFHRWRYKKAVSYLAYFQAYSNTYGNVDHLKKLHAEAVAHPAIIGLVIGTRPDCISSDILDHLEDMSQYHHIHVEFGIESVYDETLKRVNRGHDFITAVKALKMTRERGITTGAHFIFGFPGETREMMLKSAAVISSLPLDTVKFHQLQILKNTRFEEDFLQDPSAFSLFSLDEYITFMAGFLERLNPQLVVERFAGEVPPRYQVTPGFGMVRNEQIPVLIEKELETRDTWQGKRYQDQ